MNIKKFLLLLLLVCVVPVVSRRRFRKPPLAKPVTNDTPYDAIDAYVEGQMRRLNIPGVSLAIVEGAKIVYQRGFGKARPGGQAPTPQTPFVLGSTTKSFTALAVMQLVEAGKVELDAPVQHYLPWFRVADPAASAEMTVRHLLNQTGGLAMLPGMTVLADFDDSPGAAERQARSLSTLKVTRPAGAAWEYSNLNYNLLGLIVEAASGETYADYIQKHIFDPLKMSHSYTDQAEAQRNGLTVGHRYWFAIPFAAPNLPIPRGSLASGQLISTAQDMAHYLIAWLNGGRYDDAQIVSPASIAEMHRGAAEYTVMGAPRGKYGMGWFVEKIGETKVVSHGGNVPDFSSYMALIPGQKKGVVMLVNADHYGLPFILPEVGMGVTALLAGEKPPPIRLGLMPWVMRALLLIPLLQVVGVAATLELVRRWRDEPQQRPRGWRMWGQHILVPLIPNLSLAALPLFLQVKGILKYLKLYNPDLHAIAVSCGSFAGIWAFVRTVLILRAIGQPPRSR